MSAWSARIVVICFAFEISKITAYNTDTSSYQVINGPKENSYFGYSVAASQANGSLTIWSGSPKYSLDDPEATTKEGAVYQCETTGLYEGNEPHQTCKKLRLKTSEPKKNESDNGDEDSYIKPLKGKALDCSFDTRCGFQYDRNGYWLLRSGYEKVSRRRKNRLVGAREKRMCFNEINAMERMTGPPDFTISSGLIAVNTDRALHNQKTLLTTSMRTTIVEARKGFQQCLRFCFNAFSRLDYDDDDVHLGIQPWYNATGSRRRSAAKSVRSLRVYRKYNDSSPRDELYVYQGPKDIASKYWNYTEINLMHDRNGFYELQFVVSLKPRSRGSRYSQCTQASDIVLADISVLNSPCEAEPENIDVLEGEQSVGMSMNVKVEENGQPTVTACGSLWQQNCGFAKDPSGVCYEIKSNNAKPVVISNPELKGCIRGKIDIILLVDQSGSVNQCNFQKVKQWLRSMVRGFDIGLEQQDIGIVVYSSRESTNDIFGLGFDSFGNGTTKKIKMLQELRKLPYEAGRTFTGVAFKHANDMLWGPNGRSDARKMVILLTDGATSVEDQDNLQQQVAHTRRNNGIILAVGVADYNETELKDISGSENHFFPVKDFSKLEEMRDMLRQAVSYTNLEGNQRSTSMQSCQMGFSLNNGKDSLLIGSPGCFDRVGNVMRYLREEDRISSGSGDDYIQDMFPTMSPSNFSEYTTNSYKSFHNDDLSGSQGMMQIPALVDIENALQSQLNDSYLGYSVTSGEFFGEVMGTYVAASAPRHMGSGSVLIYKSNSFYFVVDSHVITGTQLGEYFGASICAVDVNSDGYTDLLVGAPLHIGANPDEGRVYVYMGGKKLSETPNAILEGSGSAFSRFGLVITLVGDVTSDGYNDVVISAPHEDNGKGAVYIFNGGRNGLSPTYSQRVAASSLINGDTLKLFGQSVFGGVDVDDNKYLDILVGTPGSDKVIILKAQPIVHIDVSFSIPTALIDRENDNCWQKNLSKINTVDKQCIVCRACFSYQSLSPPSKIGVKYKIFPDTLMYKSRVHFHDADKYSNVENVTEIFGADTTKCVDHTLYLEDDITDLMTNVTMELTIDMIDNIHPEENSTAPKEHTLRPILDMYNQKVFTADARFKTNCKDTSSCVADLSLQESYAVSIKDEPVNMYKLDESKLIRYRLILRNAGPEEAHNVSVNVYFPSFLHFATIVETVCFQVLELPKVGGLGRNPGFVQIVLSKKYLDEEESCSGYLNFLLKSNAEQRYITEVKFSMRALTVSIDNNSANNEKNVTIPVGFKASFGIFGDSQPLTFSAGSSNITNEISSDIQDFIHFYTLANTGPYDIENIDIQVQWPACVIKGKEKDLIYVNYTETEITRNGGTADFNDELINVQGNTFSNDSEVCENVFTEKRCASSFVSICPTLFFSIATIQAYQKVYIKFWGQIDLADYQNITSPVTITSVLLVDIQDKKRLLFSPPDPGKNLTTATIVYPKYVQEEVTEKNAYWNPWWLYVVSALVGLLLFLLIFFLLWKLHCFESKYAKMKRDAEEDMAANPESTVPMTSQPHA